MERRDKGSLSQCSDRLLHAVTTSDSQALVPTQAPVGATVAEIWAELLGSAAAGVHEDFFAAGGDSILAAAVVARACARLGVELPIRSFVDEPTIAALSHKIEQARARAAP